MIMIGFAECDGKPPEDTIVVVERKDGVGKVKALKKVTSRGVGA
jgi:hypothetical protein